MRIFISHATKNKEVVLKFAEFLESVSSEIEVFCSSENGSIKVGKDFIKTIFEELNSSALFIPVLSKEYYESRFCMIELGVAYSYFFQQVRKGRGRVYHAVCFTSCHEGTGAIWDAYGEYPDG